MPVYETARTNMIESQIRPNKVTDEAVIDAFARIRRELFVPEALRGVAYIDEDLPFGGGRYLIAPMIVARLLQAAGIDRKDNVLVVGAGAGYEAALASILGRSVVGLEENPELARAGRAALVEHRIASVVYVEEPLAAGHKARAPYDVILFTGSVAEVPDEIAGQLAEGGRLVAIIRSPGSVSGMTGRATMITRTGGALARRVMFDAAVPLLPGFRSKPAFVF
jgi:protein-L-isoaspartate(D-aspartate) O-methyltransferase